MGKKSSRM